MAKSQQSFNKKEREKKRQKKRKDKAERKEQRKQDILNGIVQSEFMYVDENGNLSPTPPDPSKKEEINVEDIQVSVPKKGDVPEEDPIRKGVVKFFNGEKGYGFIIDNLTQESIFVHVAGLIDQIDSNDNVTYEVEMGPKGPNAVRVHLTK